MNKKEYKNDKELRSVEFRASEEEGKMILEGYPVVFNQETLIGDPEWGWYEVIDKKALDDADLSDVPLNALLATVLVLNGNCTNSNSVQFSNAKSLIAVIVEGKITD